MRIEDGILYDVTSCNFIVDLIPIYNKTSRPGIWMEPVFFTIHNPGNAHRADQITEYVDETQNTVSWHFSVGKGVVYQELPINEIAWHASDGRNGPGNRKTIALEIEENEEATRTAIAFLRELAEALGWGMSEDIFKTHKDWSGKNCPRYLLPQWDSFVQNVIGHKGTFADDDDHWSEEKIEKAVDYELMAGYPDGTFRPEGTVKRGELATVAVNIYESLLYLLGGK